MRSRRGGSSSSCVAVADAALGFRRGRRTDHDSSGSPTGPTHSPQLAHERNILFEGSYDTAVSQEGSGSLMRSKIIACLVLLASTGAPATSKAELLELRSKVARSSHSNSEQDLPRRSASLGEPGRRVPRAGNVRERPKRRVLAGKELARHVRPSAGRLISRDYPAALAGCVPTCGTRSPAATPRRWTHCAPKRFRPSLAV
jgi:hypothetical protein